MIVRRVLFALPVLVVAAMVVAATQSVEHGVAVGLRSLNIHQVLEVPGRLFLRNTGQVELHALSAFTQLKICQDTHFLERLNMLRVKQFDLALGFAQLRGFGRKVDQMASVLDLVFHLGRTFGA